MKLEKSECLREGTIKMLVIGSSLCQTVIGVKDLRKSWRSRDLRNLKLARTADCFQLAQSINWLLQQPLGLSGGDGSVHGCANRSLRRGTWTPRYFDQHIAVHYRFAYTWFNCPSISIIWTRNSTNSGGIRSGINPASISLATPSSLRRQPLCSSK